MEKILTEGEKKMHEDNLWYGYFRGYLTESEVLQKLAQLQ